MHNGCFGCCCLRRISRLLYNRVSTVLAKILQKISGLLHVSRILLNLMCIGLEWGVKIPILGEEFLIL